MNYPAIELPNQKQAIGPKAPNNESLCTDAGGNRRILRRSKAPTEKQIKERAPSSSVDRPPNVTSERRARASFQRSSSAARGTTASVERSEAELQINSRVVLRNGN